MSSSLYTLYNYCRVMGVSMLRVPSYLVLIYVTLVNLFVCWSVSLSLGLSLIVLELCKINVNY